jgi:hypothetical protein
MTPVGSETDQNRRGSLGRPDQPGGNPDVAIVWWSVVANSASTPRAVRSIRRRRRREHVGLDQGWRDRPVTCPVVVVGTKYFTQAKKASAVDLLGVFNLSAQSGWNSSVFLESTPTQPTLTCGGSSHGWLQSANIENKSDN